VGTTAAELRLGARAVAPMLIGVAPFGLVAGASAVTNGLGTGVAIGFSTLVFAGASQLAAIEVLGSGGSAWVAVLAACTINLRVLLYSASIAPYFAHEHLGRRLGVAYLLTDQAYAVSLTAWLDEDTDDDRPATARRRLARYLGAALTLWCTWQATTVLGALAGSAIPPGVPLGFAVPLVFLVLLVPVVVDRPSVVAAAAGGGGAVLAAAAGAGHLSVVVGAVAGIVAGTAVDRR
jgi:predicted branched-subunit amino acid permease